MTARELLLRLRDALGVECETTPGFVPSWALARALATQPHWHPRPCDHYEEGRGDLQNR